MSAAFAEGGRQRILQQGMALSGLESAPQQADLLLDTLTAAALGWCCREDIPEEMEGVMAVLLAQALKEEAREGDLVIIMGAGDIYKIYDLLQLS